MNFCGLTDPPVSIRDEPVRCRCGSAVRVGCGLCISCLLRHGLHPEEPQTESFDAILAEIDVRDTDWQLGNYQILEEIGRGGMGVIYRARQRHSRRIVALKRVLSYHSDSHETLARFQREAQAAASLDHPNILPIYEVGLSEDGLPFFSMKFAPGGSLVGCKAAFRNEPRPAIRLMASVARAIEYAHSVGILHRDLKPGNILVDGRGEPLVSDFGLAKWLDSSGDLTRTLIGFGTPGYIAPEQACGPASQLGPTADIYSLGAILFDLLAGRPPFLGEHALAVIAQASEKDAPRLRGIVRSVDRDLETICARCLERDPSARYSSAGDLANDLEHWLEHKTIVARPVSAPTRIWRWTRRNPGFAATCAACLILAALGWPKFSEHRQYQATLFNAAAWQHSLTIVPFLDLDNASQDKQIANEIARSLQSQLSTIGPCRLAQTESRDLPFAAAPRAEEISTIARDAQVRKVLTGTKRLVDGKLTFSIHLLDPARPNAILTKLIVIDPDGPTLRDRLQGDRAKFYQWIGAPSDQGPNGETNKRSSDFVAAGRALMDRRTPSDMDKAIDCFEKAVVADSSSAQAYAILSTARIERLFLGGKPELLQLAEIGAKRAVELEPQLGDSHGALSRVLAQKGDLANAREEALRAIELDGIGERSAGRLAWMTKLLGRPDIALSWLQIMKHLQSQPARGEFIIGDCWTDLCEDEHAEKAYRQTMELHPDLPEGWIGICHIQMLNRNFASALRICSENEKNYSQFDFTAQMVAQCQFFARHFAEARKIYTELARKDPKGGGNFYGAVSYESALGCLNLAASKRQTGQKILDLALQGERRRLATAPHHPEILYRTAAIEASLGLKTSALDHLRAAAAGGWIDFRSLALDPRFDPLRGDPLFDQISESMARKVASLRQ
jgi:tetratricopeptide (TPR) repeat protein/tRNA A-37 threonylcarbamoyl transferase component Bud32/TolB-like protein